MFFTTFLALGLRQLLWWENKRLDRVYGEVVVSERSGDGKEESGKGEQVEVVGEENYGVGFRFVL